MDDSPRYRIGSLNAFFLISFSLTVDLVQAILDLFIIGGIINRIISPFVYLILWTWFHFLGIKFAKSGKNAASLLVGFIIEMIPYIDLLPGWTVSTIILISNSRREDAGKKSGGGIKKMNSKVSQKDGAGKTKEKDNTTKRVGSEVTTLDQGDGTKINKQKQNEVKESGSEQDGSKELAEMGKEKASGSYGEDAKKQKVLENPNLRQQDQAEKDEEGSNSNAATEENYENFVMEQNTGDDYLDPYREPPKS